MVLSPRKAYLVWILWAVVLTALVQSVRILLALASGDDFEWQYWLEEFGWIQEAFMMLALLAVVTFWWPILGTKTKQSSRFFLISLATASMLIVLMPYIANGVLWILSGGSWNPSATDAGFGVAGFILLVFIPVVLIAYLVIGLIVRKRSLRSSSTHLLK